VTRGPDIVARVHFLSTAEGGRTGPCRTGYRCPHDFGLGGSLNDGRHEFEAKEWISPGETDVSRITLLNPDAQVGRLYEGFTFTVQEGSRIVGNAVIVTVLNPDLAKR
jgi:translation elongation factor EF-Tu-like GTPase